MTQDNPITCPKQFLYYSVSYVEGYVKNIKV